ncbi:hypothetical protein J2853_003202 [Streptosporangium lutulentum]|uniref:Uncharacterized protein n=1 Tax=Streptosporangium lutulentum TaxID=1461250 RepID=A0ABT9QB69_9ACTN|nr:hypothetical protein [Streptosporangium lutulentum]
MAKASGTTEEIAMPAGSPADKDAAVEARRVAERLARDAEAEREPNVFCLPCSERSVILGNGYGAAVHRGSAPPRAEEHPACGQARVPGYDRTFLPQHHPDFL